jgi:hypothetical protein
MKRIFAIDRGLFWSNAAVCSLLLLGLSCGGCPEECPKGKQECACNEGKCDDGLTCQADKCVTTTNCPVGTAGCPCDNGGCQPGLTCNNNVCEVAACPVGTQGCPCDNGACQTDLRCNNNVCEPVTIEDGITIGAASVRACDIMFDVGSTGATQVVFDASVLGKFRKEGGRLALSFTARQDAALSHPVAQVQNASGTAVDISAIAPSVARCFDRLGGVVADPAIHLR